MKILRLELLAFGPFMGESLVLDEGQHGLHVIYGRNEAGKSSSLRALRQLLYGIPHNSSDNFIHPHQNLRIGGLLESAGGERLQFIRRKGRSITLRGPDDVEVIDPSLLNDMLGGVDEATFSQRFGIDYAELRQGGEAVVRGGGDLGEILFAAGSGIADVHQVQFQIESEMQELFKRRGSIPRINDAIKKLKAVRNEIKDIQVPTSEWVKHDQALRNAEKRQAKIDEQLREKRTQKSRLERIDKALPLSGRRNRLQEQLAEVAQAPMLPDEFSGDRREAIAELANAQQTKREASNAIEKLQMAIVGLNIPTALLEHRTAITRLHTDLGSYQKAAKDRPGLVARLERTEQQARTILQDLGREPELQQIEQLRLRRAQRQRIQSLTVDCKARLDKQSSTDQAVHKLYEKINRVDSQLAELPVIRDAGELKRAIRRAQKQGDLDQQLAVLRATLRELEKQAEVDLSKLRLWSGTLEQLEKLPVPALETIERFENEMADATSAVERIEERIDELTHQAQKLDQSLQKLRLEQDVPTEQDLVQARKRRDAGWQLVRQSWHDDLSADDPATIGFIGEYAPGDDLARAFQVSIEAADAIADRLRREADRVAKKAKLTTDRQELDHQFDEQKHRLIVAQDALKRLQSHWSDQWTTLNIDPLSPREMRSWLSQQKSLAKVAETIRKQRGAVEETAALVRSLCADLNKFLEPLGQSIPNESNMLARILEHCETVVDTIESETRQRRECEKNLQKLRDELSEAEQSAQQAKEDLQQWRIDWSEAVAALGLDRNAAPSEANLVIEAADELFRLIKEADDLRSRIEGIDRDAGGFKRSLQRLFAQTANDLLELAVDQAVADLYDRLEAASTAQTKLDGWKGQLETEKSKRDKANSKIEQLQAKIKVMCQQAGCSAPDDLPAAEQRSVRRREIKKELEIVTEQLDDLAAGGSLDEWIAEAQQFDPDRLRADLQRLGEEISQLDREKTEITEAIGSHRNELRRMDGSGRAAAAQEQAEHLLAAIRSDAEQYIRLRLASAVLRRSIERFRQASQGPVLSRAGELFAELTLGSFGGLRADYDDQGNAVLVGIRTDSGQAVNINCMSDGTCDQLYLALRLALLESYLNGREPLPFIVDDILIMFDDDRAVAALKALARLSEKTQVIFFTHHEHLVRLVRDNFDNDVLFTHSLDHLAAV